MEFRESLFQLRRERGLNQEQLAEQIGVSRQAVSKWETGEASPDLPNLLALADALGVSLDALCGREAQGETVDKDASSQHSAQMSEPSAFNKRKLSAALYALAGAFVILLFSVSYHLLKAPSQPRLTNEAYQQIADSVFFAGLLRGAHGELKCDVTCTASNAEDFTYTIRLDDGQGNSFDLITEYDKGRIHGERSMLGVDYLGTYTISLLVSDNRSEPRAVPLVNYTFCFYSDQDSYTVIEH